MNIDRRKFNFGTILRRGAYNRPSVKQWTNFLNSKRSDQVIVDSLLLKRLKSIGYDPEFNPASYYDVNQLWEALEDYGTGFNADVNYFFAIPEFEKAIKLAYKTFGRRDEYLTPLSGQFEIYSHMQKNSSSGLPDRLPKEEAFPTSYSRFLDVLSGTKAFNPCLSQFRTQRKKVNGKPVGKTRNIFAYPFDATIYESRFFYPLQSKLTELRTPYAVGMWRGELGARLSSTLRDKWIYELDYSRFDASIPKGLIKIAFNIIKTWYKKEYHEQLDKVCKYFVYTPIVMADGHLYTGKEKGIPSGSCFTQIVGTMVNFILSFAVNFRFNMRMNWYSSHFVGDDGIFCSNTHVSLRAMSTFLAKFGLKVNASKSRKINRNEAPHFVGFDFYNCIPTKSPEEVISNLCYSETYRKYEGTKLEHLNTMMRQILLLSKDSSEIVYKHLEGMYSGKSLEYIKAGYVNIEMGSSGYLAYRNKYLLSKNKKSINLVSAEFLK